MSSKSAPPEATVVDATTTTLTSVGSETPPAISGHVELSTTTLAKRYQLLGLLGSGGMGTVYRARDLELDEIVALKVLKSELAQSAKMIERFRREVKLARRVTHKNVARTFDIGEDAGDHFLTMEYVDGDPLAAVVRGDHLSTARAIAIGRDVCDGLVASHEAGVVHGDLKPENVICARSGRAVITDFGIARALSHDPSDSRTAGAIAGTPQYMAPEQVEGAPDLDGRADIYALGCMLFRLFTGELPWIGSSYVAIAAARLLRPPPDPSTIVRDLPRGITDLVLRCMARDREERFASAAEVADALERAAPHAMTTSMRRAPLVDLSCLGATKTVAVLPLGNDGATGDAYLAAAVTDELIDLLSAVPRLRVRPRGATTRLEPGSDAREAGRALGVDAVVCGSSARLGDAVRVKLRLVTVADGFQLWARRFEAPASELYALADDAAAEIAKVLVSEKVEPPRDAPTDPLALDLYLRGRYIYARSYYDAGKAIPLLAAAHARAPRDPRIGATYALALLRKQAVESPASEVSAEARALAESLVAQGPNAEAHVALAIIHLEEGEYRSGAVEVSRALAIDPDSPDALDWLGRMLLEGGRPAQALETLRRAREADPLLAVVDSSIARAHAFLGEWDAADATLAAASKMEAPARWLLRARFTGWRGDRELADRMLRELEADRVVGDAGRARTRSLLRVVRDGTLTDEDLARLEDATSSSPVPRRVAFRAQLRVEMYLVGGLVAQARASLAELEDCSFFDLTWLDSCPLLEPLRQVPALAALRRQTERRVARALEVLDAAPMQVLTPVASPVTRRE